MEAERDGYDQTWRSQVNQDLTEQSRKLSDAKENLAKALRKKQLVELRARLRIPSCRISPRCRRVR